MTAPITPCDSISTSAPLARMAASSSSASSRARRVQQHQAHPTVLARVLSDVLGERRDGLRATADLLERLDDAVGVDLEHRLDVEERRRQAGGLSGTATLDQVVQGVEQEEEPRLAGDRKRARLDARAVQARGPRLNGGLGDQRGALRRTLAVDDAHGNRRRRGGQRRRLKRPRQRRRKGDDDDLLATLCRQRLVGRREVRRRRL